MKISDLIQNGEYNWDVIEKIPEFARLKDCQQNSIWHSEGNAWVHTKMVCENMQNDPRLRDDKATLMAAALFHDIGKGVTTELSEKDGKWHSYGHEIMGEKITRYLLWDDKEHREDICAYVRWHMEPLQLRKSHHLLEKIFKLASCVPNLNNLILLKECDIWGQKRTVEATTTFEDDIFFLKKIRKIANSVNILYGKQIAIQTILKVNEAKNDTLPQIDVTLYMGLSGSGKSTCANNELKRLKSVENKESIILSRDAIREELGFVEKGEKTVCSYELEDIVTKEFNKRLFEAAQNGKHIIIDNLNLSKKTRDSYKSVLAYFKVNWTYWYVEAKDIETNLSRRNGQIDEKELIREIYSLDWPTPDEYISFFH